VSKLVHRNMSFSETFSRDGSTGGIFLMAVLAYVVFGLGLQFGFYLRKKKQPIKSRFPVRSQGFAFSCLLLAVSMAVSSDLLYSNCPFGMSTALVFGLCSTAAALIRVLHVVVWYERATERLKELEDGETEEPNRGKRKKPSTLATLETLKDKGTSSFFVRYSETLLSRKFQIRLFAFACVLNIGVYFMYIYLVEDCFDDFSIILVIGAMASLYAVAIILLAFRVRNIDDGLYVKMEMKIIGYITLVAVSVWSVANVAGIERYIGNAIITFGATMAHMVAIGWPLYKSYKWEATAKMARKISAEERLDSPNKKRSKPELMLILESNEGHNAFHQFLVKEFSSENLELYDTAVSFLFDYEDADDFDESTAADYFKRIYEKHIKAYSPHWVNISDEIMQRFKTLVGRLEAETLSKDLLHELVDATKECSEATFYLMSSDSFRRFKVSPAYQELYEKNENGELDLSFTL